MGAQDSTQVLMFAQQVLLPPGPFPQALQYEIYKNLMCLLIKLNSNHYFPVFKTHTIPVLETGSEGIWQAWSPDKNEADKNP